MGDSWHPEFDPDVVKAHETYVDAINSNNADQVMDCYDQHAVVLPPDEPICERPDPIRQGVDDPVRQWVETYFRKAKTHWRKISKVIWVAGDYGFDQGVDFAVDIPLKDGIQRAPAESFSVKGILIYKRDENGTLRVYRDIFNANSPPTAVPLPEPGEDNEKCAPAPGPAPRASGRMDPDVVKAHQAYVEAINSNETERVTAVMACYDKDAAVMPPDAPLVHGHEALRKWVAKYFKEYRTTWGNGSQVVWTAGDYGFDQGVRSVDSLRKGGPAESLPVKGILIYKRQESGELKVFRDIWNYNSKPRLTRIERR
jgi:ketosteroid isomerase-like protein